MHDNLDERFLPRSFFERAQNACKLLLYKFLLDESMLAMSQRYEVSYIAARMVCDAWPLLIERQLSFGIQDKFLAVCKHVQKASNSSEAPNVRFVEGCLKESLYSSFLREIKTNLAKYMVCWDDKSCCPYKLSKYGPMSYIETNEVWIDYCFSSLNKCRTLYYDGMQFLLYKRNKDISNVSEFLKNCFGEEIVRSESGTEGGLGIQTLVQKKKAVPVVGISEEDYEILEQIPIEFLFKDKDCTGRVPQLLTLEKQPQIDITHVADLFTADQFKRRWLAPVVELVKNNYTRIIAAYNYFNQPVEIPANVFGDIPLGISMKMFIEEYVDRINAKIALLSPEDAEPKQRRLNIFSEFYDSRNESTDDRTTLGKKLDIGKERLRQLLMGDDDIGLTVCANLLKGFCTTKNFALNSSFQADFMQLELSEETAFPQDQFDIKYGLVDEKTKAFLFDVTDWKSTTAMPSYIGPVVFRNSDAKNISAALSEVRKILDEKILPASLDEEIVPEIMNRLDIDNQTINAVCDIIRKSDAFEESYSDIGTIQYTLKWKNFCSVPSRLARILYEFGTPTHLKDVYAEYNRRAEECGLYAENNANWFTKRPHPFIKTDGKGMWEFSTESQPESAPRKSVISTIEEYIQAQGGKVTFDETAEHLQKVGCKTTENSIRVYLGNLCRTVRNSSGNVFVYKPWIDRFPHLDIAPERNKVSDVAIPIFVEELRALGGYATVRELVDAYYRETRNDIRDVTARQILDSHSELFMIERVGDRNIQIALVNNGENTIKKESSVDFHNRIREDIVKMLREVEGHQMRMNLITREVSRHVPKDQYSNIVYTIINNMSNIEKYEVEGKVFLKLKDNAIC